MHQHIIINHDGGLYLVIVSEEEQVDLKVAIDEVIMKEINHAEGAKKT